MTVLLRQHVHDPQKTHYEVNEPRAIITDVGTFQNETAAHEHACELHAELRRTDSTKVYTFSVVPAEE
jgi:hypothetical protein